MLGAMRTLAVWLFIAAVAAVAVWLARMPTVADGKAIAADRLEEFRKDGVTAMDCDEQIPVGRNGAAFTCTAALRDGASQIVDFVLKPDGSVVPKPQPPTRTPPTHRPAPGAEAPDPAGLPRKRASADPRSDRP